MGGQTSSHVGFSSWPLPAPQSRHRKGPHQQRRKRAKMQTEPATSRARHTHTETQRSILLGFWRGVLLATRQDQGEQGSERDRQGHTNHHIRDKLRKGREIDTETEREREREREGRREQQKVLPSTTMEKVLLIETCLRGSEIDLWRLRELALTRGGLMNGESMGSQRISLLVASSRASCLLPILKSVGCVENPLFCDCGVGDTVALFVSTVAL